jgi:hypothetical protein
LKLDLPNLCFGACCLDAADNNRGLGWDALCNAQIESTLSISQIEQHGITGYPLANSTKSIVTFFYYQKKKF